MTRSLTARQARRIVQAAQSLSAPASARQVTRHALVQLARRLGAIQIDSVNVMVRAHYMPAFARLGAYDPGLFDRAAWGRRPSLFEYWGHVASLMPIETQPLFRWRMAQGRRNGPTGETSSFGARRADYISEVLGEIRRRGPVTGGDFAQGPRRSGWWNWSDGKRALEWLFRAGEISVRTRRGFERVYDLTERVVPPEILAAPTPGEADAKRELVRIAARAMGVATVGDLADYFRILQAETRARADELVEEGALERVEVEGWRGPVYLDVGARAASRPGGAALLSPFDNLIWRRERAERLFGLRYTIGIYTPAHKREHGYYVYPFLLGERIVARVDLKADRRAGRLLVQAAHLEAGASELETVGPLARQLEAVAGWQGLDDVAVTKKGGLAAALSRELG